MQMCDDREEKSLAMQTQYRQKEKIEDERRRKMNETKRFGLETVKGKVAQGVESATRLSQSINWNQWARKDVQDSTRFPII